MFIKKESKYWEKLIVAVISESYTCALFVKPSHTTQRNKIGQMP